MIKIILIKAVSQTIQMQAKVKTHMITSPQKKHITQAFTDKNFSIKIKEKVKNHTLKLVLQKDLFHREG